MHLQSVGDRTCAIAPLQLDTRPAQDEGGEPGRRDRREADGAPQEAQVGEQAHAAPPAQCSRLPLATSWRTGTCSDARLRRQPTTPASTASVSTTCATVTRRC